MRGPVWVIFIVLMAGLTFFGLGPVLLADGSFSERMLTLAVVILLYILLVAALRFMLKRLKR
jgi:uncharacterized membrane protein